MIGGAILAARPRLGLTQRGGTEATPSALLPQNKVH
jgi:hypothetical protein